MVIPLRIAQKKQWLILQQNNNNNKWNNNVNANKQEKLNAAKNAAVEAFNLAQNQDVNPEDGIADGQFNSDGLVCWSCESKNWDDCARDGHVEKCRSPQVILGFNY